MTRRLNFLFLHQNFPGQYVHAAHHLVRLGHNVVAIGQEMSNDLYGVRKIVYSSPPRLGSAHAFEQEFDHAVQNGLLAAAECEQLASSGFSPDLICGHNGWGETLFVKEVWPSAPLLSYFEYYYRSSGSDFDYDPEFPQDPISKKLMPVRNCVNHLGFESADWGQTPTQWQYSLYPDYFRDRISVLHEGVDVELVRPDPTARILLRSGLSIGAESQVITYCARNLEPYRGFHIFMRSLPRVLRSLPDAIVVIVGGNGVSYGHHPHDGGSWKQAMIRELGDTIDLKRVHFLGRIPFRQYLTVLQLSTAHVYLTYPFVLSWSFIEALAAGCCVIASRSAPVGEVAEDGLNALLFDFFDTDALSDRIIDAVRSRAKMENLRQRARMTAIERFDLRNVCLPAQVALWNRLTGLGVPHSS